MQRPQLLAFDLDGTLLHAAHQLPGTRQMLLHDVQSAGIEIVFATGRPYAAVTRFAKELDLHLPMILLNGAAIFSVAGDLLWSKHLPRENALDVLRFIRDFDVTTQLYLRPTDTYFYTRAMNPCVDTILKKDGISCRVVENLVELVEQHKIDPLKIFITGTREVLTSIYSEYSAANPGTTCVFSEHTMLEFLAPEVSKGQALKVLCAKIGVPLDRVIAFGDNLNDRDMLRTAGIGVAMASAPEEMREESDYVVDDLTDFLRANLGEHLAREEET